MQKELNKKLRLDSINWAEVIKGLEGKTTFSPHDIKRALRKTGRSFNNNGPFHTVVRSFIEVLGKTVTTKITSGETIYTISSTEAALQAVSPKKKTPVKTKTWEGSKLAIPVTTTIPQTTDEDKIRGLFNRSYIALEHSIYLLAVLIRHSETNLSGRILKTELIDLGVKWSTFTTRSKSMIDKIFELLDFNPIKVHQGGLSGSSYDLSGPKDLLDEYTHLTEIYEKLSGTKPKNLDDYIISSPKEVTRRYEAIMEKQKKFSREPRTESDPEVIWKKWLLISSSKNALGASRSIGNLLSWIKTHRHYTIEEKEAEKLYQELMVDSEGELKVHQSHCITMTEQGWTRLKKFYTPTKFKETIFVKLPISLETATYAFPGLIFRLDETTTSGMYLYMIELTRSVECEISLKKLLRFIRVAGKIYTDNSWMVKRVLGMISDEDSDEKAKNSCLLVLE